MKEEKYSINKYIREVYLSVKIKAIVRSVKKMLTERSKPVVDGDQDDISVEEVIRTGHVAATGH